MTTTPTMKTVRVSGNLYDVTIGSSFNPSLPWGSVEKMARDLGFYRIEIDQSKHRPEGESETVIVELS